VKTLVIYLMAGHATPDLAVAAVEGGADIVELGFPFSDPLADGPVIRRAGERALAEGMRTRECLDCLARTHELVPDTPLVPMTYAALLEAYGWQKFATDARGAGATSLIVADLPAGERPELRRVQLPHRARCGPADVVGDVDVHVVELQDHPPVAAPRPLVEVGRDQDHRGHLLVAQRPLGGLPVEHRQQVGVLVGPVEARQPRGQLPLPLDHQGHRLLAHRDREQADQHGHAERGQERGRDRPARAEPDHEVQRGDGPDRSHARPLRSAPRVAITAAVAKATSTATSTSTGSGVTRIPWNAHSSTPTA